MKLAAEQLSRHLERGVAPVYLIAGDEPLLVQEAADLIRAAARTSGCQERVVISADGNYDWASLTYASASLSLFSARRLIEVRLPSGKPGQQGAAALVDYVARPAVDTVLLIVCGKLDGGGRNAKWVQAIAAAGVFLPVWPIEPGQLPQWIRRRMQAAGLQPTPEAAQVLAERVEGNLLAAVQEIEKLRLQYGTGKLDADTVIDAVASSARYDVYKLVDAALAGDALRVIRILDGLRGEGTEAVLVVWALARELRLLAGVAGRPSAGALDQSLAKAGVWEKRRPLVKQALARHDMARWRRLLQDVATIDRVVKGAAVGNAWDELLQLALNIAGKPVIHHAALA
ncbi:MAG: DNA polymerase III subunit delta [Gammaproteobacteria bacterium]|nr:MAG: DNA polymerase III subunit delta [Gammaproteobacteria bacterium]TND06292.1 MAG: DNA polymerase III subunit delta [Gammaproteobacteria bacterium]